MPLSQTDFANDGDSPLLVEIKAQRWDEATKYISIGDKNAQVSCSSGHIGGEDNGNTNNDDRDDHTMMKKTQKMVSTPDEYGNLPLHAAIGFRAPDEFLLRLIRSYPDACFVHGTDNWTPLHVAAMYGCSLQVMDALIRVNPNALDDDGSCNEGSNEKGSGSSGSIKQKTPRHYASKHNNDIKELLLRSTEEWMIIIQNRD